MIITYTDHNKWRAEAIRRSLTIKNETGYTEDLCADAYEFAYDAQGDRIGHCIGGPESELSAILGDTVMEYAQVCNGD